MDAPSFDLYGLTALPFGLPGHIYRSAMPFGAFDPAGRLFEAYQAAGISGVVVLADAQECQDKTGIDLLAFYRQHGLEVIHSPIPDFNIPPREALDLALDLVVGRAQAGQHTVVHCSAGQGRTGTFLACLAHKLLGLDGATALAWVRASIPGAVENVDQERFVKEFAG